MELDVDAVFTDHPQTLGTYLVYTDAATLDRLLRWSVSAAELRLIQARLTAGYEFKETLDLSWKMMDGDLS